MRIMGLDYGSKTVGVAVCDPLGYTAQAVETIVRKEENKFRETFRRIEELAREFEITSIVLGYPKNMDGSVGERARKTEEFKDMLERRTGFPVILWDERRACVGAKESDRSGGGGDHPPELSGHHGEDEIWIRGKE